MFFSKDVSLGKGEISLEDVKTLSALHK